MQGGLMHLEEYCLFGHMFHIPGKLKMAKGDGMMGQCIGLQKWMANHHDNKSRETAGLVNGPDKPIPAVFSGCASVYRVFRRFAGASG